MNRLRGCSRQAWLGVAALAATLAAMCPGPATANVIALQDSSFEAAPVGGWTGQWGEERAGAAPTSWTWINYNDVGNNWLALWDPSEAQMPGSGSIAVNGLLPGAADGYQCLFANQNNANAYGTAKYVGTFQAGEGVFEPGVTYTLQFAGGRRPGMWNINYTAALLADGADVAVSDVVPGIEGTFVNISVSYTAKPEDAGKAIGIELRSAGGWTQASFDNVRLTAVVPEPTSLGVLAGAAVLLGVRRRAQA